MQRFLFLAHAQHIDEGKLADAIPVYQRALMVLDIPDPIYDQQRATIAGMEKELEKVVKKPPSAAPKGAPRSPFKIQAVARRAVQ